MRQIKFKAWNKSSKKMSEPMDLSNYNLETHHTIFGTEGLMQFTGLLDKKGLQEVYEGDIIDEYGNIKGNTYEMDAGEADFIIQGFGDKNWGATYKEAMGRGCTDTQRYADTDEVRKLE